MIFPIFVGPNGTMPTKGSPHSAGRDLYAAEDVKFVGQNEVISTDIFMSIPTGTYGRIAPRSGLALKHGINILAGVIDADYTGEIKVIMSNPGINEFSVRKGDRIAQLIVTKIDTRGPTQIYDKKYLIKTDRGDKGFGSTDLL